MNPFALPGPAFLEFFAVLSSVVIVGIVGLRLVLGPAGRPQRRISDPYGIALLRGGTQEAIRVVVMNLVKRKLLHCAGRNLTASTAAIAQVPDEADRDIIMACLSPIEGCQLLKSPGARFAFSARQRDLEGLGLAPDGRLRRIFLSSAAAGILIVGAFGIGKLCMALASGHTQVFFLIVLLAVAVAILILLLVRLPRATPRGRNQLRELQALFRPLQHHAVADRPEEALFLAAVFGAAALPVGDKLVMQGAFAPQPGNWESKSGCGSSSCASSGAGSGCGGGGGGGGCGGGGCGGCGGGS